MKALTEYKFKLPKINYLRYAPYVALFCVLLFFHSFMQNNYADDKYFCTVLQSSSLIEHTVKFYTTWSARTLIEALAIIIGNLPVIVWRISNSFMITFCAYAISSVAEVNSKSGAAACCALIFAYSWQNMYSAGWVITTMVYIWPLAALLAAAMLCKKAQLQQKASACGYAACTLLTLYAFNMEQINAFALILLMGFYAALIFMKKRIHTMLYIPLFCSVANLIYAFTSPGTAARMGNEIVTRNKTFNMLNALQKIEQGFSVTMRDALFNFQAAVFVLSVLLVVIIFIKYKKMVYRALACALFSGVFVLSVMSPFFMREGSIFYTIRNAAFIDVTNVHSITAYLPFLMLCAFFAVFLLCVYLAFGHSAESYAALLIFFSSIASRVALGLSPTLIASGERTAVILIFGLCLICMMLYEKLRQSCRPVLAYSVCGICFVLAALQAVQLASLLW